MNIRAGTLADLPRLAQINSLGSEDGRVMAEDRLPAFINAGNIMVAEENNEVVGLLYWKREFFETDNWELTQITVDEKHRGKGIAETLVRYFLNLAKSQGVGAAYADVRTSNIASAGLMNKLGGEQAGSLDVGDGDLRIFWKIKTGI